MINFCNEVYRFHCQECFSYFSPYIFVMFKLLSFLLAERFGGFLLGKLSGGLKMALRLLKTRQNKH